jgi:hypothetical protein
MVNISLGAATQQTSIRGRKTWLHLPSAGRRRLRFNYLIPTKCGAILIRDSILLMRLQPLDARLSHASAAAESGKKIAMSNILRDATCLSRRTRLIILATAACLVLPLMGLRAPAKEQPVRSGSAPQGWLLAGSNPENYETGVDSQAKRNGFPIAYLKSKPSATEGFGTLMQMFSASKYAGQRIRLSASVKADEVKDWAGLWMRVDVKARPSVLYDGSLHQGICRLA